MAVLGDKVCSEAQVGEKLSGRNKEVVYKKALKYIAAFTWRQTCCELDGTHKNLLSSCLCFVYEYTIQRNSGQ